MFVRSACYDEFDSNMMKYAQAFFALLTLCMETLVRFIANPKDFNIVKFESLTPIVIGPRLRQSHAPVEYCLSPMNKLIHRPLPVQSYLSIVAVSPPIHTSKRIINRSRYCITFLQHRVSQTHAQILEA
jgi:hypothetical protein